MIVLARAQIRTLARSGFESLLRRLPRRPRRAKQIPVLVCHSGLVFLLTVPTHLFFCYFSEFGNMPPSAVCTKPEKSTTFCGAFLFFRALWPVRFERTAHITVCFYDCTCSRPYPHLGAVRVRIIASPSSAKTSQGEANSRTCLPFGLNGSVVHS